MAEQEQERPSVRRRSSFGRALDRVRDALKRRRSGAAGEVLRSTREEETIATTSAPVQQRDETQDAGPQEDVAVTEPMAMVPGESIADSQLVPDDGVEDDMSGNEEPLTPAFSNRMGVSEDKAKALFERYGLKYQPRTPASTGSSAHASKIRRVEKPVRIRIHWTCHECDRQFGHDRACVHCGHRRCRECSRSPPKKVKAILEEAKQAQIVEEQKVVNKEQILAAVAPESGTAGARDTELEPDDKEEQKAPPQYVIEQRPRSAIKLVLRSKTATVRRTCHECLTPFASNNAAECAGCGHQRCNACPMRSFKSAGEHDPPFEPTMVATVQRVYRKPRQRVRWKCDRCETMFADGQCHSCNHQRCEACVRSP